MSRSRGLGTRSPQRSQIDLPKSRLVMDDKPKTRLSRFCEDSVDSEVDLDYQTLDFCLKTLSTQVYVYICEKC